MQGSNHSWSWTLVIHPETYVEGLSVGLEVINDAYSVLKLKCSTISLGKAKWRALMNKAVNFTSVILLILNTVYF